MHLAESVGGQGFGILELAIVLAEFGYGAVPGPFVPSAIASALISAHDPDAKLLNDLASGDVIAAYAIDSGLTATRHGDDLVIRGEVRAVPAAAQASVLVLPVAIDSGEEWVVLDADQLEIEPVASVDPLRPLAHVRANAVEVGDDRVLSNLSRTLARALMSTLLSAEAIGVARWATDTAAAYAKIREQFGRPIGQFQAIKHKCAEMIADTERATAAVWDAARAIDEARESGADDTAFEFAAAVAATLAPAAAQRCTQDCIQVHGGIGFTWEHDTNVYYRRALRAGRLLRPGRRLPAARRRHRHHHRDAQAQHRSRPRDREAARGDPRGSRCAQSDSARGAQRRDRRGRLGAAAPAQAVGPRLQPDRADHHRPGVRRPAG